ncbi:hypothetical protein KC333_g1037 [Hortaea werneckii]|nr:hypothetical protein KC333_g1037 [Hortaea werneckii]KAI7323820.1 hypothetical protein KC326_g1372 [Hortaea werneckii]
MKAKRPNTDQEVELVAYANGRPCTEYILPFEKSNAGLDTLTCFIPVSAGDQLTITGSFSGSVLKGTFDLLADGSFVIQKRIEPMKDEGGNSMVKYHGKRSLKFEQVLNVSTEPGRTTTLPSDCVSEGNLHVKAIERHHEAGRSVLESRVGSLTVVCSLAQNEEDTHTHSYNSCTCGSWAQRVSELVRKDGSGIPPEYELEFKATSDTVSNSRAKKHKQSYRESKFGSKPWATFVFHYRSKAAIDEADCELSPKTSAELEPADPESFVKGSTDSAKRRKPAGSKSQHGETNPMMSGEHTAFMTPPPPEPLVTPTSDQPCESNEVVEPRTPASTSSNPLFLTPPPLSKKKKKKPEGDFGHIASAASPPLFERASTPQDAVPSETSPQPQSFSSFNREAEMKEEADAYAGEQLFDHLYIMTDEELAQTVVAAEAFLDPTSRAQAEAREAQVPLPPPGESCINSETEAIDVTSAAAIEHVKREQTPLRSVRTGNDDQSFHQGTGQQQAFNIEAKLVSTSDNAAGEGSRPRRPSYPDLEKAKRAMTSPVLTSHSHSPERSPARSIRSSQGATATGCLLTASDIAEFIPPEGIKLNDLEIQFTEEDLPNTLHAKRQFLQLVRRVANNVKDLYFLKPSSQVSKAHLDDLSQQRQQKSRSQFDVSQSSFQEVKASMLEPDYNRRAQELVDEKLFAPDGVNSFNHKATSEPLHPSKAPEKLPQQTLDQQRPLSHSRTSVKPTIEGTPAASERTLIPQATPSPTNKPQSLPRKSPATVASDTISHKLGPKLTPELPDHLTGGLKRSASTMTASPESTSSSKKPKFEELSARKLALQKSLAEKKARKAEARKAFEELQKHREQEEQRRIEAEEREIAMLERMAADEEEEYTELVEATEAEEVAIAEAKVARERAEEAVRLSEGP